MQNLKKIITTSVLVLILTKTYSQPPPPPPPPCLNPPCDVAIPVDGGISLLVVAGAAYGVKRLRERKKKDKIS